MQQLAILSVIATLNVAVIGLSSTWLNKIMPHPLQPDSVNIIRQPAKRPESFFFCCLILLYAFLASGKLGYHFTYLLVYTKISCQFVNFCKATGHRVWLLAASQTANRPPRLPLRWLSWEGIFAADGSDGGLSRTGNDGPHGCPKALSNGCLTFRLEKSD
jgi:hypothetical protein